MIFTLLSTVLVLGVLILVHELGHFWMAKLADIEVPRFSIGLGPKLIGFRRGETEYVISWVPLGGYVRMAGMEEMEGIEGGRDDAGEEKPNAGPRRPGPRDFESKSVAARVLVISAGVIMNVILAFLLYTTIALGWGVEEQPPAQIARVETSELPAGAAALADLPEGTRVSAVNGRNVQDWQDFVTRLSIAPAGTTELRLAGDESLRIVMPEGEEERSALINAIEPVIRLDPVIGALVKGMPAERAGLEPDDRIVSAAGRPVETWQDLVDIVQHRPGQRISIVVERGDRRLTFRLTPEARPADTSPDAPTIGQIGVQTRIPVQHPGPIGAVVYGARQTWYWTSFTVDFLVQLVTGHTSPRNLGGPIMIGKLSGEMARAGLRALLSFMALLSINLAVFNLLPIPVLDGGQLVFLGIEAVRGKALSLEQRMRLTQVGLVFLVALMVWVVANDVLRLIGI